MCLEYSTANMNKLCMCIVFKEDTITIVCLNYILVRCSNLQNSESRLQKPGNFGWRDGDKLGQSCEK